MPPEDREQPASSDDERSIEELGDAESAPVGPAPVDPAEEDVQTSFVRMLAVLKQVVASRDEIVGFVATWLPLLGALKSLGTTAAKFGWRARQLVAAPGEEAFFDEEIVAEFREQFDELVDAFPEASALFFGVDNLDNLVRETAQDEEARAVVARFGRVVEAKMNALIGRLVEWGLEEGAPELSVEKLEGFVRGLEALLQEVLDRWVLPNVYGRFDEE
ncbi:hypothetical protein FIV42_12050 [Persicimonas caeni]|uniref:Uncharacterized protein n=1 Tax=Persicimonas caeni TaxID=2292766 RepID=A0A4Y6PTI9_PERCE|nr:hypothetical protein [Persicimonas caeni]QDG51449.1 hypothetical protein FIV42_12050 [Persicimonas caeni]QED32670.1 hypothetical protein FRD00_12045 [Persicimonas caeni]